VSSSCAARVFSRTRREDYRTEVLGLVKAQAVKNAVIVPIGAKGGFVVLRPPAAAEELRAEGVACYRPLSRACSRSPTT
jgi:glutamate dehydrogenase